MRRAFTLIELMIVIAIIFIALGVLVPLLAGSTGLFPNYSDGERSGQVYKVSHKGLMFKSFEGELNLGGMAADANGTAVPNRWAFSALRDAEVESQVEEAARTGKRVTLHYHQYLVKPWRIDTPYVIDRVEFAN